MRRSRRPARSTLALLALCGASVAGGASAAPIRFAQADVADPASTKSAGESEGAGEPDAPDEPGTITAEQLMEMTPPGEIAPELDGLDPEAMKKR